MIAYAFNPRQVVRQTTIESEDLGQALKWCLQNCHYGDSGYAVIGKDGLVVKAGQREFLGEFYSDLCAQGKAEPF